MSSEAQIGFLFLTRGELNNIDLWEKYFMKADSNKYKLFIHPKEPNTLISTLWRSPNSTVLRPIPTSWGTVSLVKATLYLLQIASSNPNIKKFILLSESCIPTSSFDNFYDNIIKDNTSFIHWVFGINIDRLRIVNKSMNINMPNHLWAKQSQWMLLDRKHVDLLFNNGNPNTKALQFLNSFTYCPAADEHYFINYFLYICRCDIKTFTNKPITYVDWNTGTQHPRLFNNVTKELIEVCRNQNIFFARKFTSFTNTDKIYDTILQQSSIIEQPVDKNYSIDEISNIIESEISKQESEKDKSPLTTIQIDILRLINRNTIRNFTETQLNRIHKIVSDDDSSDESLDSVIHVINKDNISNEDNKETKSEDNKETKSEDNKETKLEDNKEGKVESEDVENVVEEEVLEDIGEGDKDVVEDELLENLNDEDVLDHLDDEDLKELLNDINSEESGDEK